MLLDRLPAQLGGGEGVDHERGHRHLVRGVVHDVVRGGGVGLGLLRLVGGLLGRRRQVVQASGEQVLDAVEVALAQVQQPVAGLLVEQLVVLLEEPVAEHQSGEGGAHLVEGVLVLTEQPLGLVDACADLVELAGRARAGGAGSCPGDQQRQQRAGRQPRRRGRGVPAEAVHEHGGHDDREDRDGHQQEAGPSQVRSW